MHSRNIRNVFVICVLHIRRVKVWFLRCKSMVFGVQKGGFCIAKVWFLFFECCVVAICLECYHNLSATKWQSVRNVLAIRQQCFGNPSAAVGVRFIVPAYMKTPTKWRTDMCVRLCGNVCAIMCIHIFDYVRIRARWIGPYAWRNVRNPFRGCFVCISLVDVALLQPVSNVVAMRSEYIHGVFATCSLSVCYIFAMQKYGFC